MTEQAQPPPPMNFNINLPPEKAEGHYADFAGIWHNNETFVLDFVAMTAPAQVVEDEAGNTVQQVGCQVVTRVRIPAAQVWEVMKGLEQQLTIWENENPGRKATH